MSYIRFRKPSKNSIEIAEKPVAYLSLCMNRVVLKVNSTCAANYSGVFVQWGRTTVKVLQFAFRPVPISEGGKADWQCVQRLAFHASYSPNTPSIISKAKK